LYLERQAYLRALHSTAAGLENAGWSWPGRGSASSGQAGHGCPVRSALPITESIAGRICF
jgi:hypothetical protein